MDTRQSASLTLKEATRIIAERLALGADKPDDAAWPILLKSLRRGEIVASGQVILLSGETHMVNHEADSRWNKKTIAHPEWLLPNEIALDKFLNSCVPALPGGRAIEQRRVLERHPLDFVPLDWWFEESVPLELRGSDHFINREIGSNVELLRIIRISEAQIDRKWPSDQSNGATDAPVAPPARYLTLAEAVASFCPPLDQAAARRAIEEALCDGRLVEAPRPLLTPDEARSFIEAAGSRDRDFAIGRAKLMSNPPPATPIAWRMRIANGAIDWEIGAVRTGTRFELPVFARQTIESLFAPRAKDCASGRTDSTQADATEPAESTGAPGRPSHMDLVLIEAATRRTAGVVARAVSDEAKALHQWFKTNHSGKQAPSEKTIENRIRIEHKRHVGIAPESPTKL